MLSVKSVGDFVKLCDIKKILVEISVTLVDNVSMARVVFQSLSRNSNDYV